jgi:hypothetical protein
MSGQPLGTVFMGEEELARAMIDRILRDLDAHETPVAEPVTVGG